uniref:Polyprotein n=1 Tax=Apple picorna-like virus 1 TaxID=2709736 RepID=A0A6C0X4K2_9VIRU|nr:MAG: polyprotein [Apple picorna-like virus 1]
MDQKFLLAEEDHMTIQELSELKFDLTFDRKMFTRTSVLGHLMSSEDFFKTFGIRPVALKIEQEVLVKYYARNFRLRNLKLVRKDFFGKLKYELVTGNKTIVRFDSTISVLVHPKYVKQLSQFYKLTPVRRLMEYFEILSAIDNDDIPVEAFDNLIDGLSPIELLSVYVLVDPDTRRWIIESDMMPRPEGLILHTFANHRDLWVSTYEEGQLVHQDVEYVNEEVDYENLTEDLAIEVDFVIDNPLEPIIQNSMPSRAELEREYRDFINSQRNNRAGIKKDKKKSKKLRLSANQRKRAFNFYDPNPQKNKLNITENALKLMRFCSKFVKKPSGFWVRGTQSWLKREHNPTLNETLQLFANFDPKVTGSEDAEAIGSMTNFITPSRRVVYYSQRMVEYKATDMKMAWEQQLQSHYDKNPHHPEFANHNNMEIKATIELWFDLLASAMRISSNANEAFYKMLTWVFTYEKNKAVVKPKFNNLSVYGTAFFLSVVADRGLSIQDCKKVHPRLRNAPLTDEELRINLLSLYNRNDPEVRSRKETERFLNLPKVKDYLYETRNHVELVNRELVKYRIRPIHDFDKFDFQSVVAYVWQWSWPKIEGTSLDTFLKEREEELASTIPSTSSVKEDEKEEFEDTYENLSLLQRAKKGIKRAFKKIHGTVMDPIAQPLQQATDKAMEMLSKMSGLMEDLYKQVSGFFSGLTGLPLPRLSNVSTVISLIMDYLIFVNVDNVLLKGAVVMSALGKIGLSSILEKASSYLKGFINIEEKNEDTIEGTSDEEVKMSFWTKMVEWITDINPRNAGILGGIIISGLLGYTIFGDSKSITEIGTKTVNGMRSMSFIGMGLNGAGNVVKYVASLFKTCADWLRKKVGLLTDEEKEDKEITTMTKEILTWTTKLDFYYSLEGLSLIKANQKDFDEAKIVGKSFFYYNALSHDPKTKMNPKLQQEIRTRQKKAIDLLNYLHRLDSKTAFRMTPFHVQLYGHPGIGKSQLLKALLKKFHARYFSHVDIAKFAYSPNTNKAHWDGYWGQLAIIVDEMWSVLDAETLTEWLTILSCLPVLLPIAALDAKDDAYFKAKLVFSCSNVMYPHANGVACDEAVWRRRLLVKVEIDEDVFDKTTGQFSMSLFKRKYKDQDPNTFPHLSFTILRSVPDSAGNCEYQDEATMPDGLKWPVNNIKFDRLMEMLFSSYDALCAREPEEKSISEAYAEWEALITDVMEGLDCDMLQKTRDFVTVNKSSMMVQEIPFLETSILYDTQEIQIENPVIDVQAIIKSKEDMCDEMFIDKCNGGKHAKVVYSIELEPGKEEQWFIDFQNKTVTSNGKVEPLSNMHRKLLMKKAPFFDDEFKKRFDQVEGTALEKDHVCKKEKEIPHEMSSEEVRSMGLTVTQYLNHCKVCRKGKYKFEDYVNFLNKLYWKETPQSLLDLRQSYIDVQQIYKAYSVSLTILSLAENTQKDKTSIYANFIGVAEMSEGRPVPNWKDYKETYIKLIPHFDREYLDIIQEPVEKEEIFEDLNDQEKENFFNDWDKIFLSEDEKRKIFKTDKDRLNISYCFLEHLEFENKKKIWYLKWSKRLAYYAHIISEKLRKDTGTPACVKQYEISYLNAFNWFWDSYESWFRLTDEQRDYLYKSKGVRNKLYQYTRSASFYIRKVVRKAYENTFGRFFGTLKYVWNKYYWLFKTLSLVGSAYAAVYLFQNFGQLFNGKEGTSKVFFKAGSLKKVVPTSRENEENFIMGIRKNILEIRLGTACANGVGVYDHMILMNHHFVEKYLQQKYFTLEMRPTAVSNLYVEYIVYSENVYRLPNSDLVLVFCEDFPVYRKILHKFRTEAQVLKHDISDLSLYYNLDGTIRVTEFPFVEIAPFRGTDDKGIMRVNTESLHYIGNPPKGSSGGILYAPDNYCTSYIVGIQCWRDAKRGYGNLVTQEKLRTAIEIFREKVIEHEGPYECLEGTSLTEHLITEHIMVEGVVPEEHIVGIVHKSSFVKTPIAKYFPSERIPAILRFDDPRVPDGTHPLQHSINKSGRDIMKPLNPELLDYAVQQLSIYYSNRMASRRLKILTFEETLEGLPMSGNVSVNVKTSPGIPWVHKRTSPGKKDYLEFDDEGTVSFCAEEIRQEFNRIDESLQKGIVPASSMYEFPKDELRPKAKALGPPIKTRSISVMDFVINLVWRKYHLSFESHLHDQADGTNEYCIGINPESVSWARIYDDLKAVGDFGCDLDVGNWDGHFTAQLMRATTKINNNVYNSQDLGGERVRESLADFNIFGCFQFLDLVLRKMRGLPSGCAGTGHLNTLGHFLFLFYLFCKLWRRRYGTLPTLYDFMRLVCKKLYGDDVIMSIHPTIIEWWNGNTIAEAYSYYGWPTTSAKKTSNPNQILPIEDLTFLKRHFVHHEVGVVLGALEKDVIQDLLHWMRRTANNKTQFEENLRTALEYAFGHGELFYNELYKKITDALKREQLPQLQYTYQYMRAIMIPRIYETTTILQP